MSPLLHARKMVTRLGRPRLLSPPGRAASPPHPLRYMAPDSVISRLSRSFRLCLSAPTSLQTVFLFTVAALPLLLCLWCLTPGLEPLLVQAVPHRSRLRHSASGKNLELLGPPAARIFLETSETLDSPEDDLLDDSEEFSEFPEDVLPQAQIVGGTATGRELTDVDDASFSTPLFPASDSNTDPTPTHDAHKRDAQVGSLERAGSGDQQTDAAIGLDAVAFNKIKMSHALARGAAEGILGQGGDTDRPFEGRLSEGVGQTEPDASRSLAKKEAPLPEAAEGSPCTKASVEARLKAIGCPLDLANKHFALDYKQGVRIKGREFREERASKIAYVPQVVSDAPSYEPLAGVVLVADIDEPGIGSDVRLLHLVVRPSVCEEKGADRCTIPYLLPPVPVAEPAHRIVALGFDSPTGKRFKFTEVLKLIQQKPLDVDLRRVSLSRLIEENEEFFRVRPGTIASPSWNVFKVYNAGPALNLEDKTKPLPAAVPGKEVPKAADAPEKTKTARAAETHQARGATTKPEFGGYSPGSGGQLKPSTIFGYVLGSLLVIAVFVGIVVVTSDCVSGATKV
ncbi:putative transmembrane protein [Toxoplasma gondii GAB2-2007-GAL-DOM2]|uniref:Putative transmembrane protein n=3 Tax=Toxoplasma gondii TaxID=5811 RepID=A0A086LH67_TOXGO|nr:putative transmembrane protein [Toxoplasma gondii GAB2-2007-GAL-DOM2]KFG55985.1 putative transmembrane protein [Toxoplasma gondii FOU]PUA91743.1 putative transmembrane protein [Toxoplasma gondii TgCATBr9]